jgi:hypothetical protein
MKAYKNIKFQQSPDISDIRRDGRKSIVGRIKRGESYTHFVDNLVSRPIEKVCRNERGYCSPIAKAATRRTLKHRDCAIDNRFEAAAEGGF